MYEILTSKLVFILCEYIEDETRYLCSYLYKRICNHLFSSSNKVLGMFDSIPHWKYVKKWESNTYKREYSLTSIPHWKFERKRMAPMLIRRTLLSFQKKYLLWGLHFMYSSIEFKQKFGECFFSIPHWKFERKRRAPMLIRRTLLSFQKKYLLWG